MCGGAHYGEVKGLVSVERCVAECTVTKLRDWSL